MMTSAIAQTVQSARPTPAPWWRVALACLLDLLLVSAGVGGAIVLFQGGSHTATVVTAWLVVALLAVQLVALVRTGQPFGWRLFRVRLVSLGGFPGVGLIKTPGSRFAVADVMRGVDPLMPVSRLVDQGRPDRRSQAESPNLVRPSRVPGVKVQHAPDAETRILRRTRDAVPVRTDRELEPIDAETRVQTPANIWVPPRGVGDIEPVAEATIFAAIETPRWRVMLDDSDIGPLTEPMVFGRNPETPGGVRAVSVMDLTREVSKQHVRITLNDAGTVHAEDLGSTNGSYLVRPDGTESALTVGAAQPVESGCSVRFSGHMITLTRTGGAV